MNNSLGQYPANTTNSTVVNEFVSTTVNEYNIEGHTFNSTQNKSSSCLLLNFEGGIPWNNNESLVSYEVEDMVHRIKYTVILPVLFLIGAPANVINMAVFYKQGLKERINVCLFSLSLVDFLSLVFNIIFYAEQAYLQMATQFSIKERHGPLLRFMINHNLPGFYGLPWVSQVISAIIASERCLCVLWPLRSQTIFSTTTTTIIIVIVSIVLLALYFLDVTAYRVVCAYNPLTDSITWVFSPGQFFLDNQEFISFLSAYVFGVALPGLIISVTVLATVVTVVKLHQAAAWRASTSSVSNESARDTGLTVMLVYNSIFFIICMFPAALRKIVWLFLPELGVGRKQHNLAILFTSLIDAFSYINATFNIVIYYTMGSRYRQTFWNIVGRGSKAAGHKH